MTVLLFTELSKSDTQKGTLIPIVPQLLLARSTTPTFYATTTNGFITNELWKQNIVALVEWLNTFKAKQLALLLLDWHSTHLELSSCKLMVVTTSASIPTSSYNSPSSTAWWRNICIVQIFNIHKKVEWERMRSFYLWTQWMVCLKRYLMRASTKYSQKMLFRQDSSTQAFGRLFKLPCARNLCVQMSGSKNRPLCHQKKKLLLLWLIQLKTILAPRQTRQSPDKLALLLRISWCLVLRCWSTLKKS